VNREVPAGKRKTATEIGWREYVGLPELGIPNIRAKVDTGARTSALHATRRKIIEETDGPWVEFHVPVPGTPGSTRCRAKLVDRRPIKNTSGVPEERLVVRTPLVIDDRRWSIEVSLADRENMGFELILGRTAIRRHRILVNPGRSFLTGQSRRFVETLHEREKNK
jgi:hypothetical protein